jgi:hypothetical protein
MPLTFVKGDEVGYVSMHVISFHDSSLESEELSPLRRHRAASVLPPSTINLTASGAARAPVVEC